MYFPWGVWLAHTVRQSQEDAMHFLDPRRIVFKQHVMDAQDCFSPSESKHVAGEAAGYFTAGEMRGCIQ